MKTKIILLTMTTLAAAAFLGCGRQSSETLPDDQQASTATNVMNGAGASAGLNMAITNSSGTNNLTVTNQ